MLTNGYIIEPNPYTKHAEYDKCYLDQLEINCTKMTKTRSSAFGDSDKLDYKLLGVVGGVFCIYFYILSLLAQQCFTFFLTTFVLNKAMALQCQHYAYHLIHFLLAHFFTFASKLLFDKICQLTNCLLRKVCSVVKRKYLRLSSLNCANLYRRLRKCKMRQSLLWKEKLEDKQALISLYENKRGKKRKTDSLLKKNFFEHLQLRAYKKIRSSQNLYQKFTNDTFTIKSNYTIYNTKIFNTCTVRNFQVLTLSEIHYVEFSRTQIGRTQPLSDSPGTSHDQRSVDNTVHNDGANDQKIYNPKHPFKRIFNNGLNKKNHPKNITVGFFRNTITKNIKNKRVFHKMKNHGVYFQKLIVSKYIRKVQQGKSTLSKEKRKFKWKKRHKQFVVFKVASKTKKPADVKAAKSDKKKKETVKDQPSKSDKKKNETVKDQPSKSDKKKKETVKNKPLHVDCICYKDDYLFDTAEEFDERAEYFKLHYENCVGKSTEADKLPKEVLKNLKDQEMGWSLISPTAFGFRHQVELPLEPLTVNWEKLPNAKLCTCPYTECTCMGNSAARPANIPTVGYFSVNLPAMMAIELLHDIGGHCLDGVLRRLAPSPHSTLFPNLENAVTTRKTFFKQRDAASVPADYCTSACKDFNKKAEQKVVVLDAPGAKQSVFNKPSEVEAVKDEAPKPKRRRSAKSKGRKRKKGGLDPAKSKHPQSTLEGGPEPLEGGVEPTKSKRLPSTLGGGEGPTKSKHSPSTSEDGLEPSKSKRPPSTLEGGEGPAKSKHSPSTSEDGLEPTKSKRPPSTLEGGEGPTKSKHSLSTSDDGLEPSKSKRPPSTLEGGEGPTKSKHSPSTSDDGLEPSKSKRPPSTLEGGEGPTKSKHSPATSEDGLEATKSKRPPSALGGGEGTTKSKHSPSTSEDGLEPTKSKRPPSTLEGGEGTTKSKHSPSTSEDGLEPTKSKRPPSTLEGGEGPAKSKYSPSTSEGGLEPTKSKRPPSTLEGGEGSTKSKHSPSTSEGGLVSSKSKQSSSDLKDGSEEELDSLEEESEEDEQSSEEGIEDVIEDSSDERLMDGLQEEEIQGAGDIPLYRKDDNIYARGFLLTAATQTEFDEDGNLLRADTDRVKIAFKLRYSTKRDIEGTQIQIEQFQPCAEPHPTRELTLETLLHVVPEIKEKMSKVKKGIEETLKSLSGSMSSYKRSWRLGVEEMTEHISSYAKELQSRVRIGLAEHTGFFSDKSTCTCDMSDDAPTKPKYRSNSFEKEIYTRPTRGLSWPDVTPKMRYDEGNQTDNMAPAKSENKVLSKLEQYLNSLKKEREDKIVSAESSKRGACPYWGKSRSEDCLIRTKNTHDFFNTECKPSPTNVKQTDSQLSKRPVKCLCYHPKPSKEDTKDKKVKCLCHHPKPSKEDTKDKKVKCLCHHPKPSKEDTKDKKVKCLCHHPKPSKEDEINTNNTETDAAKPTNESVVIKSEDNVNTTPNAAANIANEQQESLKVTSEPVTNNANTAKEMPANDSNNLIQTSQQKSGKTKCPCPKKTIRDIVAETPDNLKSDTAKNNADTAEELPSAVSDNVKGASKQRSVEIKSAENVTPKIVPESPIKDQDNLKSDTVKENEDNAEEEPACVSGDIKGTSKQKSVEFKSTKNITPDVAAETPIKYQESFKSDTVKENTDAAKEAPADVSDSVKEISKKKKSETKSLENTTPSVVAKKSNKDRKKRYSEQKSGNNKSAENISSKITVETPNKLSSSLKSETMEYNSDTVKEAPVNISNSTKLITKEKSIKSEKSKHTSKMVADTPIKPQESIKSNIMENNADIAKEASVNYSDNLKQISDQKSSKAESPENISSEVLVDTPIKNQDSPEMTPDTDIAKETSANAPDNMKQSSKQKSGKAKCPCPKKTIRDVETPNEHQDNIKLTPDAENNNTDAVNEVPASVTDSLKQTSKQKSGKTKCPCPKKTIRDVVAETPDEHRDNIKLSPDTEKNNTETIKEAPVSVTDSLKQTSKQKSGKIKCPCPKKTIRDIVAETPDEHRDNIKLTPDAEKNNTETVKEAPASVTDSLKQTSKQKSGKTKCPCPKNTCKIVAKTPNEHQDNLELTPHVVKNKIDTANEAPAIVPDNIKQTSDERSSKAKFTGNILSEVVADKPTKNQDSRELVPDTVKTDIVKEGSAGVSDDLKQTSKQKSGTTKSGENTSSKIAVETPNKHPNSLKSETMENYSDTAKEALVNISNSTKRITKQKSIESKKSKHTSKMVADTPIKPQESIKSNIIKNNADIAKEASASDPDNVKQISEQNNDMTKSAENTTPRVETETAIKHKDSLKLTPDVVKNRIDTSNEVPASVPDNMKQTSDEKSSKAKYTENILSEVVDDKPAKNQDSRELVSDTVKTDIVKEASAGVSDNLNQTSKQKSGKTKSDENTSSKIVVETSSKHPNSFKSETMENNFDTAKEAPVDISNSTKRITKQKSIKSKQSKHTSKMVAVTPIKPQESIRSNIIKNNADIAKEASASDPDNVKQISEQNNDMTKSAENTTPRVETETAIKHKDSLKLTPDVVKNKIDTSNEVPASVPDNMKQTSDEKSSKAKYTENILSEVVDAKPAKNQDSRELVSDTVKTDIVKEASAGVSDNLNQTSKQKSGKTKSDENTSSKIVVETSSKHPKSFKSETMENNFHTAKEAPVDISNSTKRITKQNSIKSKQSKHTSKMVADTPIKPQESIKSNIIKNNADIAKEASASDPDNVKHISEQNNGMTKSAENTTPRVETETAIKHKDSLGLTSDVVKNKIDTSNEAPASVPKNMKQTSDERSSKAKSTENILSEVLADKPTKHQDSREFVPDTVKNNTDIVKEPPAGVSYNLKQSSKQKSGKTKCPCPYNTTRKVVAETPNEHQDHLEVTPHVVKNKIDTANEAPASVPDNIKQTSDERSSKAKSTENILSEVVANKPTKNQDSRELVPDTVKTDIVKEASAGVLDNLKQTSKQKSGTTKSAENTSSKIAFETPNKHPNSLKSEIMENYSDTEKEALVNISNSTKRISKQKSIKSKKSKHTSKMVADTPIKPQESIKSNIMKNNAEIAEVASANDPDNVKQISNKQQVTSGKEAPENISHTMKRISEQETSKIEPVENTTPEVKSEASIKHQDRFESDIVKNNEDTAKKAPVKVSDSIKQISEQKTSQTKLTKNTTSAVKTEMLVIHQDGVVPDVVNNADTAKEAPANVSDSIKQTSKQKNSKTKSAKNTRSEGKAEMLNKHQDSVKSGTVKINSDTAKEMPVHVTSSLKQIFDHESGKIKSAEDTTPEVVAETPVVHTDDLESDVVKNYTKEASTKVSDSIKQTSKQKKSKTKFVEDTTPEDKAETLNKNQVDKSDTIKNNTDSTYKEHPNASDSSKQIFEQKSGKTKSAENITPEVESKTPNDYQDSVSDTKKNNADIVKITSTNVSDTKKQTSKQKNSKIKSHKSASDTVINSKLTTNNSMNDKIEDKTNDLPDNNSNIVKLTPEQISSTTESIKKLTSQGTTKALSEDADYKDSDSTIVTPETLANNEKQSSREVVSKKEDLAKAASDDVVECNKTTCEYYKIKAASEDLVDSNKDTSEFINSKMAIAIKSAPEECSSCDCDIMGTVCAENCKRSIKNIPETIAGIDNQNSLQKGSSVSAPEDNDCSSECSCCDCDTVGTVCAENCKRSIKNIPETIAGIEKQNSLQKGSSVSTPEDNECSSECSCCDCDTVGTVCAENCKPSIKNIPVTITGIEKQNSLQKGSSVSAPEDNECSSELYCCDCDTVGTVCAENCKRSIKNIPVTITGIEKQNPLQKGSSVSAPEDTECSSEFYSCDCGTVGTVCADNCKRSIKNIPETITGIEKQNSLQKGSSVSAPEDNECSSEFYCCDCDTVGTVCADNCKRSIKNIPETIAGIEKQNSLEKGISVRFAPEEVVLEFDKAVSNEIDNRDDSICLFSDINDVTEDPVNTPFKAVALVASAQRCQLVSSVGFVLDNKMEHNNIACEDIDGKVKNKTMTKYKASSKRSCRDVYGRVEDAARTIPGTVAGTANLSWKSIDYKSSISLREKLETVPNTIKRTGGTFNLKGQDLIKSSSDSKIIKTKTVTYPSWAMNYDKIINSKSAVRLGNVKDVTKKTIIDSPRKLENDNCPATAKEQKATAINSNGDLTKSVSIPSIRCNSGSQMTPLITISNGTEVVTVGKLTSLKYCSRYCPHAKKRKKGQHVIKVGNRSKTTHDEEAALTKSNCNNIESKIQETVKITPDLKENECGVIYKTITTASVVHNATNVKYEEDNYDDTNGRRDELNSFKTDTLLLHKQSKLYYSLMPEMRTSGDIKRVTDNDKNFGNRTTKVTFISTDAKKDSKREYEAIESSLNSATNNERSSVYYRCRRKSKAGVNSATTMDD